MHLLKLAVGIKDLDHLKARQKEKIKESRANGEGNKLLHFTRNFPKKTDEILNGGSIYWVIKGFIRVRQCVLNIKKLETNDKHKKCIFVLDPRLITTEIRSIRAFQGWRYLDSDSQKNLSKDYGTNTQSESDERTTDEE